MKKGRLQIALSDKLAWIYTIQGVLALSALFLAYMTYMLFKIHNPELPPHGDVTAWLTLGFLFGFFLLHLYFDAPWRDSAASPPPFVRFSPEELGKLMEQVEERIGAIPNVELISKTLAPGLAIYKYKCPAGGFSVILFYATEDPPNPTADPNAFVDYQDNPTFMLFFTFPDEDRPVRRVGQRTKLFFGGVAALDALTHEIASLCSSR